MRNLGLAGFAIFCVSMVATESAAIERTAIVFRENGEMGAVSLSGQSTFVQPSPITSFDWLPAGSTMDNNGRILTMNSSTDELVAIEPSSGRQEILSIIGTDIWPYNDDIALDSSGELVLNSATGWSGISELFRVDPTTGELTFLSELAQEFSSFEYHDGAFYGGTSGGFWRIDPQTYEVTLIQAGSVWCGIWGLASVGDNLWCGITCGGSAGADFVSSIGIIDPATGDGSWAVVLAGLDYQEFPLALEVIEAEVPIPALTPIGATVLIIVLGMIGVAVLRR